MQKSTNYTGAGLETTGLRNAVVRVPNIHMISSSENIMQKLSMIIVVKAQYIVVAVTVVFCSVPNPSAVALIINSNSIFRQVWIVRDLCSPARAGVCRMHV